MNKRDDMVPLKRSRYKRDPLKISILMGYLIVFIGYINILLNALFSGFSLFLLICNYLMSSDYHFMSYFSQSGPEIIFLHIYICTFCCIFSSTYTLFAWILTTKMVPKVLLTISTGLSIVTLMLSYSMIKPTQLFYTMTSRQPDWYVDNEFDTDGSWKKSVFIPFKIQDIFRCIFFILQTLIYLFGHRGITDELIAKLSLD